MRAQLVHLSGPLRGRTYTYREAVVSVGTAPDAVARYPGPTQGVAPRHAEIEFFEEGCSFHLRALDGPVFVNRAQVREVILEHNDLLEFGVNGPKARFRVFAELGSVCKPVRVMLDDARDVQRESGAVAGAESITRDLFTQATPRLKIGFPLLVLGIAIPVAALAGWFGGQGSAARGSSVLAQQVEELQDRIEAEQARAREVSASQVEALRQELAERTVALDLMREESAAVREVYDRWRLGVCLVQGKYGFRKDGNWLETRRSGRLESEYTGSGFLVTDDGWIATNRHVAAPWTVEESQRAVIEAGYEPRFTVMRVFFPGRAAIDVNTDETRLRADEVDVALIKVDGRFVVDLPVLPLAGADGGATGIAGDPVLVVGYPTGVNALLAKADPSVVGRVTSGVADLTSVLDGLASDGAISPLITRGSLNDLNPKRLVYDADTTSGGSGGPVFGRGGEVIGVNFAVVRNFTGSNLGVPISFVRELLAR